MKTIKGGVKIPRYIKGNVRLQSGTVSARADCLLEVYPDANHDAFSHLNIEPVTADIDPDIIPENIRKDINILGCTGSYSGNPQEKTVVPSAEQQVVVPDSGFRSLSKVTVKLISLAHLTALPQTSDRVVTPGTGFQGLSALTVEPVTAEIDPDIVPENIKEGVTILGVTGTMKGGENAYADSYSGSSTFSAYSAANIIRTVRLPEGVTYLETGIFSEKNTIEEISFPSTLTSMGEKAFYKCSDLKKVTFAENTSGLRSIPKMAFYQCGKLEKLQFPEGLETIEYYCCYNCGKLKSVYIPKSVTYVERNVFVFTALTDVYYGGTQAEWDAFVDTLENGSTLKKSSLNRHYNATGLP